jgi:hypothetical protein
VWLDGKLVHLTPTEFRLLVVLAEAYGEVVPYMRMIERLWGQAPTIALQHLVSVHASRIRTVLRSRCGPHAHQQAGHRLSTARPRPRTLTRRLLMPISHLGLLILSLVLLLLAGIIEWPRVNPAPGWGHPLGWFGLAAFVAAALIS